MTFDDEVLRELVALEESLWREATRFDRAHLDRVLAPDFHEFGRSGRRWSREEVLAAPAGPIDVVWPLRWLEASVVSPGAALLTYVCVLRGHPVLASNRSSLWVRGPEAWQLRLHHGSPTDPG